MRRFSLSPGTVLGGLALFVALGGTAYAATTSVVNIADPNTPANKAMVSSKGQLMVGDAGSPLTVGGTVTSEQAAPSTFDHYYQPASAGGCETIASPPANKALIVTEVRVDTYEDPSPGSGQYVAIYSGANCDVLVGDVNPPTVGETVIPFDPGLGVPAGGGISVTVGGSIDAEIYADAYTTSASAVPSSGTVSGGAAPPQVARAH